MWDKNGKKTSKTRTPGFFSNSKYTYYLSDTYEKQKGWIVDNEKYYHFDITTARMDKNKWVDGFYVGSDGARLSNMMFTLDGLPICSWRMGRKPPVSWSLRGRNIIS